MDREMEHQKKELETIAAVPTCALPSDPRAALEELSRLGCGVTCYHPNGHDAYDYKIYIRALEQIQPWRDPRLPIDEYIDNWRAIYRMCAGEPWVGSYETTKTEGRMSA